MAKDDFLGTLYKKTEHKQKAHLDWMIKFTLSSYNGMIHREDLSWVDWEVLQNFLNDGLADSNCFQVYDYLKTYKGRISYGLGAISALMMRISRGFSYKYNSIPLAFPEPDLVVTGVLQYRLMVGR